MLRRKRRESDPFPDGVGNRRPVVAERDGCARGSSCAEVVPPAPPGETHGTVVGLISWLPGDGARRVEQLDPIGHLVATVWMVRVIHPHSEHLPGSSQRSAVEGLVDPAGAVDRGVTCWIGEYGKDGLWRRFYDGGHAEAIVGQRGHLLVGLSS